MISKSRPSSKECHMNKITFFNYSISLLQFTISINFKLKINSFHILPNIRCKIKRKTNSILFIGNDYSNNSKR